MCWSVVCPSLFRKPSVGLHAQRETGKEKEKKKKRSTLDTGQQQAPKETEHTKTKELSDKREVSSGKGKREGNGGGGVPSKQEGGGVPSKQGGGSIPYKQGGGGVPSKQEGGGMPSKQGGGSIPSKQGGGNMPSKQGGGTKQGGGGVPSKQRGGGALSKQGASHSSRKEDRTKPPIDPFTNFEGLRCPPLGDQISIQELKRYCREVKLRTLTPSIYTGHSEEWDHLEPTWMPPPKPTVDRASVHDPMTAHFDEIWCPILADVRGSEDIVPPTFHYLPSDACVRQSYTPPYGTY